MARAFIAAVVLCAAALATEVDRVAPLRLEYSLDGGASWAPKADAELDAGQLSVVGTAAHTEWSSAELQQLRQPGATYRVRLLDATAPKAAQPAVVAALALEPCTLVTAKQYATPLTTIMERYAAVVVGGRVTALKHTVAYNDAVCDVNVFKRSTVRARLALSTVAPLKVKTPEGVEPVQAAAAPEGAGEGKKAGKAMEEDNRSFLEKYWIYIVMFLGYSVVSSLFAPKQGAQGAAQTDAAMSAACPVLVATKARDALRLAAVQQRLSPTPPPLEASWAAAVAAAPDTAALCCRLLRSPGDSPPTAVWEAVLGAAVFSGCFVHLAAHAHAPALLPPEEQERLWLAAARFLKAHGGGVGVRTVAGYLTASGPCQCGATAVLSHAGLSTTARLVAQAGGGPEDLRPPASVCHDCCRATYPPLTPTSADVDVGTACAVDCLNRAAHQAWGPTGPNLSRATLLQPFPPRAMTAAEAQAVDHQLSAHCL